MLSIGDLCSYFVVVVVAAVCALWQVGKNRAQLNYAEEGEGERQKGRKTERI